MKIFISGSLKNKDIPHIGASLRDLGFDVFDEWFAGGYEADLKWQEYETIRGRSYGEALYGLEAKNIFDFDMRHLKTTDISLLVLPAGKSAHMEMALAKGWGKKAYVYFGEGEPALWDVMYQIADAVFFNQVDLETQLIQDLEKEKDKAKEADFHAVHPSIY